MAAARGRPSRRRLRLFVKDEAKSNSDHSGNEEANQSAEEANATATGKDSDQQEVSAPRRRGRPRIYPRPGTSNGEVVPVKKRRRDEGDSTDDDGEIDPEGEKKVDRQGHLLEGKLLGTPLCCNVLLKFLIAILISGRSGIPCTDFRAT